MTSLRIVAPGETDKAKAKSRGKIFEKLSAELLRYLGYKIDRMPNVNYAGMEIDIEGTHIATNIPLLAECKCYTNEVESKKLQAFFGKYMARWLKDKRTHGIFIVLPGINSHAKGYYRESIENVKEITSTLYEEQEVIETIYMTEKIVQAEQLQPFIKAEEGTSGDSILLYTPNGYFWVQDVIPEGSSLSSAAVIFDSLGKRLSDKTEINFICELYSELQGIEVLNLNDSSNSIHMEQDSIDIDPIVEVQKSSSFFEYQYPAAPEFFVGRDEFLEKVDTFVEGVVNNRISDRGILFQAQSGWGKSSAALAAVNRLNKRGHFAIAIDTRPATTPQFILKTIDYAFKKYLQSEANIDIKPPSLNLTGLQGALHSLIEFGEKLKDRKRLFLIFFDQFENIFFMESILKQISNMLLTLCSKETNIVFGFAWKTDLIGFMNEFPYQIRDSIQNSCCTLNLSGFSEKETEALYEQLAKEIKSKLNKALKFLLSDFSRGYPWLLKKLCAHVKSQREKGVAQAKIVERGLNREELFKEDMDGLSAVEEDTLRSIAKRVPIGISDIGEDYKPNIVQSLVDRRLLIRVGNKYDTYWDILRDYLNTGKIPVEEHYILRVQLGSIMKIIENLAANEGTCDITRFLKESKLGEKSFLNTFRDMRIIGLAEIKGSDICLKYDFSKDYNDKNWGALRNYLREKIPKNRVAKMVLEALQKRTEMNLKDVSDILKRTCAYISANDKTWDFYARVMQDWLDFADLAILDKNTNVLRFYDSSKEVRQERKVTLSRRNVKIDLPQIQYRPIEDAAIRIVYALRRGKKIDWSGVAKSTRTKSLAALEFLKFIKRGPDRVVVTQTLKKFVDNENERKILFREAAQNLESFKAFLRVLDRNRNHKVDQAQLALEYKQEMDANWTEETSKINCKIILDWVRAAGLEPPIYKKLIREKLPPT
jgi:hypothetical protein